jgi:DNA-binding MarR family transcriptional regulator
MRIGAVRRFNRFFTRRIGVLREGLLHTPYSLTEARVLFEIAYREQLTASYLSRELGLDPGYLSRIVARLKQQGLIKKKRSEIDARRRLLSLTPEGESAFSLLDTRSREEVGEMLAELSEGDQRRLLKVMRTIEGILTRGQGFSSPSPFTSAPTSRATWAGSSTATACSTLRSTAGTNAPRLWSRE